MMPDQPHAQLDIPKRDLTFAGIYPPLVTETIPDEHFGSH
jgi:hypothetical protein